MTKIVLRMFFYFCKKNECLSFDAAIYVFIYYNREIIYAIKEKKTIFRKHCDLFIYILYLYNIIHVPTITNNLLLTSVKI